MMPGIFIDCAMCGGTGEIEPGNGCAMCCTTGCIPWESLRSDQKDFAIASGRRPWRAVMQRVPVDLKELDQ